MTLTALVLIKNVKKLMLILKKSILSFVAVLAVIALLSCTAAFGLNVGPLSIASVMDEEDGIRRGLDLVGGSSITFEAILKDDYNKDNLSSDMASVQAMLQKRLDSLGYTEATVELVGDNRVTVDIPSINNPEEAVSVLGATAQLTFEDAAGNVILDGSGNFRLWSDFAVQHGERTLCAGDLYQRSTGKVDGSHEGCCQCRERQELYCHQDG